MKTTTNKGGPVIWAVFHGDLNKRMGRKDLERWNGIQLPLLHSGIEPDGFDAGWMVAAPVGHDGFPDSWIAGWIEMPETPTYSVNEVNLDKRFEVRDDSSKLMGVYVAKDLESAILAFCPDGLLQFYPLYAQGWTCEQKEEVWNTPETAPEDGREFEYLSGGRIKRGSLGNDMGGSIKRDPGMTGWRWPARD